MLTVRRCLWLTTIALVLAWTSYSVWSTSFFQSCIGEKEKSESTRKIEHDPPIVAFPVVVYARIVTVCVGRWGFENRDALNAVATIFIALFTLTLWLSTRKLWGEAKRSSGIAEKTAAAAQKAADVAERALVDLERPYIFVDFSKPIFGGSKTILQRSVNLPGRAHRVNYSFVNRGRTPALLKERHQEIVVTEIDQMPSPVDASIITGEHMPTGIDIGQGNPAPSFIELRITEEILQAIENNKSLFLIGFVKYADIFKVEHRMGFCGRYDWSSDRFVLKGDERYNYTKNE